MSVKFDPTIDESWKNLTASSDEKSMADRSQLNWVIWTIDPTDKVLKVAGSGTGGLEELNKNFTEDLVQFGALRLTGVDRRQNVTSNRAKFVGFSRIGGNVKAMVKAQAGSQRKEISDRKMNGLTLFVELGDGSVLEQVDLAKRLIACGGAHKPSHYDFGYGEAIPVETLLGSKPTGSD